MSIISSPAQTIENPAAFAAQHITALALAQLISKGLTPINWHIPSYAVQKIDGHVFDHSYDDAKVRAVVGEYADLLGAPVRVRLAQNGQFQTVTVSAVWHGVQVEVWGHVAVADQDKAVA